MRAQDQAQIRTPRNSQNPRPTYRPRPHCPRGSAFLGVFAAFFGVAYLVLRALRGKETVVPGSPVLLTAILCAEAAGPFVRPLL